MGNKENLKNLATIDQERAREIRSLGGKARQQQRRERIKRQNTFMYFLSYAANIDGLIDETPGDLTAAQRDIIKKELLQLLINKGFIKWDDIDPKERQALAVYAMQPTEAALNKWMKPYHKRPTKKKKKHGLRMPANKK